MRRVIYSKSSVNRSKLFSIRTSIYEDENCRYVVKTPMQSEAEGHICHMVDSYNALKDIYKDSNITVCECHIENREVIFEYVEGVCFEREFDNICRKNDVDKIIDFWDSYKSIVYRMKNSNRFENTEEFVRIFGNVDIPENIPCSSLTNIDMLLSNLIRKGDRCVCIIDYEWMFSFPIPLDFVIWRSMFCSVAFSRLSDDIKERVYIRYGMDIQIREAFMKMEIMFQKSVRGDGMDWGEIEKKYLKSCISVAEIEQTSQDNKTLNNKRKELEEEIYMLEGEKVQLEKKIQLLEDKIIDNNNSLEEINVRLKDEIVSRENVESELERIKSTKIWKTMRLLHLVEDK